MGKCLSMPGKCIELLAVSNYMHHMSLNDVISLTFDIDRFTQWGGGRGQFRVTCYYMHDSTYPRLLCFMYATKPVGSGGPATSFARSYNRLIPELGSLDQSHKYFKDVALLL